MRKEGVITDKRLKRGDSASSSRHLFRSIDSPKTALLNKNLSMFDAPDAIDVIKLNAKKLLIKRK